MIGHANCERCGKSSHFMDLLPVVTGTWAGKTLCSACRFAMGMWT